MTGIIYARYSSDNQREESIEGQLVLYDDKIDFYFNFKDNAKSLTLSELNTVSDLSASSPPNNFWIIKIYDYSFFYF